MYRPADYGHRSRRNTMGWKYQRRTQKGMGRTEKITQAGVTKNPRLLKACNTSPLRNDMGEFFFI